VLAGLIGVPSVRVNSWRWARSQRANASLIGVASCSKVVVREAIGPRPITAVTVWSTCCDPSRDHDDWEHHGLALIAVQAEAARAEIHGVFTELDRHEARVRAAADAALALGYPGEAL
jgi:hypothetical protein